MSVLIDILLVVVFVSCVVRHFKLGLACSVFSAGKYIFAFILASMLRVPIASLVITAFSESKLPSGICAALSGIIAFAIIFVAVIIICSALISIISKIQIPILSRFDKLLGLVLGLVLGVLSVALLSTVAYSIIELVDNLKPASECMNIYSDSAVFKFIYDLNIFGYIREII